MPSAGQRLVVYSELEAGAVDVAGRVDDRSSRSIRSISPTCTWALPKIRRARLRIVPGTKPARDHLRDQPVGDGEVVACDHRDVEVAGGDPRPIALQALTAAKPPPPGEHALHARDQGANRFSTPRSAGSSSGKCRSSTVDIVFASIHWSPALV